MPKRYRPHIPVAAKMLVAHRQLMERGDDGWIIAISLEDVEPVSLRLEFALKELFRDKKFELHHRPALVNRQWNARKGDYDPPANDPDHLVYLAKDEHRIETRVRGIGAQRSDLAQRRYNKRVESNRKPKMKRKWPSRPFAPSRVPQQERGGSKE